MTAAATPLILPPIAEPWYAKTFRMAGLPKAAEKVWACIKFVSFQRRSSTITITDRLGSQWCSAHLGIHVGRRCFQKGLKQLEDLGLIVRHRRRGGRVITITVNFAGPRPKPRPRARAAKGQTAPAPMAAPPAAPEEPPPSPEECRQAAATLRALVAEIQAQEPQDHARDGHPEPPQAAPIPRSSLRRFRPAIPDAVRRQIEEKERLRLAGELEHLRAIPEPERSDDQRRRLDGLTAELTEPGTPPVPSGP